jgi:gliding motility-associated-like protein
VTSSEGCIKKDTLYVKVDAPPTPSAAPSQVPTAFSPNGDGQNDIFRANLPDIPKFDFLCVWTRWGQEVFRTQSLSSGWDGRFRGSPMPAGAYVWMIQGTDYAGRLVNRKGTVTIVR